MTRLMRHRQTKGRQQIGGVKGIGKPNLYLLYPNSVLILPAPSTSLLVSGRTLLEATLRPNTITIVGRMPAEPAPDLIRE